jgi:hypothetical protein
MLPLWCYIDALVPRRARKALRARCGGRQRDGTTVTRGLSQWLMPVGQQWKACMGWAVASAPVCRSGKRRRSSKRGVRPLPDRRMSTACGRANARDRKRHKAVTHRVWEVRAQGSGRPPFFERALAPSGAEGSDLPHALRIEGRQPDPKVRVRKDRENAAVRPEHKCHPGQASGASAGRDPFREAGAGRTCRNSPHTDPASPAVIDAAE